MVKNGRKQFQRQNLRHQLALAWLKTHRMDVYEQIQAEIDKVFPLLKPKTTPKTVLPDSLKRLK